MSKKWIKMKTPNHRWWHWITKPFKTYALMKYLRFIEEATDKEMGKDELNRFLMDMDAFGKDTKKDEDKE